MEKNETLVMRADRVLFMKVGEECHRMKGFTAGTKNMNPTEYTRKYIDETFERTTPTGMSVSIDFTFDMMKGNPVHEALAEIIDGEKLGSASVVTLVEVMFDKMEEDGKIPAIMRDFSVIGSTAGDGTDAYVYSGAFRVEGDREEIIATAVNAEGETLTGEKAKDAETITIASTGV